MGTCIRTMLSVTVIIFAFCINLVNARSVTEVRLQSGEGVDKKHNYEYISLKNFKRKKEYGNLEKLRMKEIRNKVEKRKGRSQSKNPKNFKKIRKIKKFKIFCINL